MGNIRVAIVDDHQLFRGGIIAILNETEGVSFVLEAENGAELLQKLKPGQVDVVLLDLDMPVMNGRETLPVLKKQFPEIKTLIISMHGDDNFIQEMMTLGASGYLLKNAKPEELEAAIIAAQESGYYFNDTVSKAMLRNLVHKQKILPTERQFEKLNDREMEILRLICNEQTTHEIADKVCLSPRTVEGYRKTLLEKTGSRNTAGLVLFAIRNNLI